MKTYYDIQGDGGSDVVGQVEAQQTRIAKSLQGVRFRLAIGSGKGGVGKSTLTTLIGRALQLEGWRVAVLDADLNGPTQARLSGLGSVPLLPGSRGIALPRTRDGLGVVSLGAVVAESQAVDFQSVLEGSSHVWRATREFALLDQLLETVEWGKLDALLVDLPPGAERSVQFAETLGAQTAFVLVTVPSDTSRGVVARSLAALSATPNPLLGYVENMKGYYCPDCGDVKPLFPEATTVPLDLPLLGSVPFDPELASRCDRGASILDAAERPSAQAVRTLGRRLMEILETTS